MRRIRPFRDMVSAPQGALQSDVCPDRERSPIAAGFHLGEGSRCRLKRAGHPATMARGGTSLKTVLRDATIAPSPTCTPGAMKLSVAIQTSSPMVIGLPSSGKLMQSWLCVPAHR